MKKTSDIQINTIDDCVEDALKSNNHDAIVNLLIKEKPWTIKCFVKQFKLIIKSNMDSQEYKNNGIDSMVDYIYSFPVVSPAFWNSYLYDIESGEGKYKRDTEKKWLNEEILPPREVIIQLCLCMTLSVEESNFLLRAAGYHALYYADVSDVVAIFYLQHNCSEFDLSKEEFCIIKRRLNHVLRMVPNISNYGTKKVDGNNNIQHFLQMEKVSRGSKFIYIDQNEGHYYECKNGNKVVFHPLKGKKPAYDQKIKKYANEIRKQFTLETEDSTAESILLITEYMKKSFVENMSTEDEFFHKLEQTINYFGEIHYGSLQLMEKYLASSDYYKKNIYDYEGEFTVEDKGNILNKESRINEIIFGAEELLQKDKSNQKKVSTVKKNIVTTLLSMEYKHLDIENEEILLRGAGSFSDISRLLEGRKEKDIVEDTVMYLYEHPSKNLLIRMLVALGREDEIGRLMIRAGYWEKDWIFEKDVETCNYLSALDWMIIYMIRYRDCLLEKWALIQGKSVLDYKNQNRKVFPFHRMVLEVSEYIQKNMKPDLGFDEVKKVEFPIHNANRDKK